MARSCLSLILAAGEGTRMRSDRPKVLHEVAGKSMLGHVMDVSKSAETNNIAIVAGSGFEAVSKEALANSSGVDLFQQKERLGTAHAVLAAREALEAGFDDVVVLYGDTPLLRPETIMAMRQKLADGAAVVVLGFETENPTGYGRLLEDNGKLVAIREHKDASEAERQVTFCNGGIMGFAGASVISLLDAIGNDNAKGEYYLTDAVEIANEKGLSVEAIKADERELIGVNNKLELAEVETLWQERTRKELMNAGITLQAPQTVFFNADTVIEPNVILEPNIVFGPGVTVKTGATIRAFSHLEGAIVGEGAVVGPYARLRPGTRLEAHTKVGNFVEVKNADVLEGAKINHLSYVGDAEIGSEANIGAGTITCNYDGMNKHKTIVGAKAFVGSNSSLVAPVTIGDGAYVGSGSVITEEVPDNALGLGRGRQVNKDGAAETIRARTAAIKEQRKRGLAFTTKSIEC